jgi:hypothetical protein
MKGLVKNHHSKLLGTSPKEVQSNYYLSGNYRHFSRLIIYTDTGVLNYL